MDTEETFPIGAAARLSGLTAFTLRKWETRHGAITPARTAGGDRRYSRDDVARLSTLKRLVDAGHSISSIAQMPIEALDALLDTSSQRKPAVAGSRLKIAVVGETVPRQLSRRASYMAGVHIAHTCASLDELADVSVDAVVLEIAAIDKTSVSHLHRVRSMVGDTPLVVAYAFASMALVEPLSDERTALMRMPLNYRELERVLIALVGKRATIYTSSEVPAQRFARGTLARIASTSPALMCECPRHTAELVLALSEFEEYSAQCEKRSPADAKIHGMLKRTSAIARSLFEDALVELAAADNIDLSDD